MRLKINSPIFSPPELMSPGRGVVAKAEDDPGGIVEDKGDIYKGRLEVRGDSFAFFCFFCFLLGLGIYIYIYLRMGEGPGCTR